MNNCIKNMTARNRVKKRDEKDAGKVRATISISGDLHPESSESVRIRMKERRVSSFSNFIEILIAEDTGLKSAEAVAA